MTISTHPKIDAFLSHIHSYTNKHNKKLKLNDVRYLRCDGSKCAGWCDGDVLTVATKNPLSLEVLVHEFAHLTQAVKNIPEWRNVDKNDYSTWLDKQVKWNSKNAWEGFLNSIILERDCERRALSLIKKWDLPLDRTRYTKQANLYLFFYHYVYLRRKWRNSTTIYKPELVSLMPEKLVTINRLRKIDMDLMDIYHKILN